MDIPEHITKEPNDDWLRVEKEGHKPFYKTPFPRRIIGNAAMLRSFLAKENTAGRMLDITEDQFSFKRKYGLQRTKCPPSLHASSQDLPRVGDHVIDGIHDDALKGYGNRRTVVELLTRDPEKVVEHKKLLSNSAKQVDRFRHIEKNQESNVFEGLKKKLAETKDIQDIITCIIEDEHGVKALTSSFSDLCLAEISQIEVKNSPLSEFPPSVNENVFCKVVQFGMMTCPQLISMVINLVVKKEDPVLPSDVFKIATLFSGLCYSTNHDLDALVKLRSLIMEADGLSNLGLDILSDCGLAQCSRSLSNHRDLFAEVGRAVMDNTAANYPYQSILDNCDLMQEHLTVEVIEKETIDTSNLSTVKKSKEEALSLFCKEQVLLDTEENKAEKDHLLYVIGVAAGKVLAAHRPEAKKLASFLPAHHNHSNAHLKPTPAITFILKPYPYQETKNPDMIKLMIRIQRQFLYAVAKSMDDEEEFIAKLKVLENPDVEIETREKVEKEVKDEVLRFGVWIGAGDLLTVKMVQEAVLLMSGSATAFGRLEFLGPFRLQLLHMKMKKVCQDYSACMRSDINFDDKLSLPWLAALTRAKVSNKAKDIKKNDSSFELHDQFITAVQSNYLLNMFDNFVEENAGLLRDVSDTESAVDFVLTMLAKFGIQICYDPRKAATDKVEGEDDLFAYCKDMVERLLLSLCYDVCEEEGDAEGLRALRRVMIPYFLAQKPGRQDSKYAAHTLIDLVVELAESERTRRRMDLYVVINPSGTAGGGLFRDKFEEHCIRAVKDCLRGTHGGLDDIKMEKEIGGLSVLTGIQQHGRSSVLRGKQGKEHSKDLVGVTARELIEENVCKYDPFNRNREVKHSFLDKSRGSPFHGLTESDLERFIQRKRAEYRIKYR